MAKLPPGKQTHETQATDTVQIWAPPTLNVWLESVDESRAWLIDHILPQDALVLISGQQKRAYKTWFAFNLALCIATGKGSGLILPKVTGPVIFVEEEGTQAKTKERFIMLCNTLGIEREELSNIYFAHRKRIKLDDDAWRKKLVELVRTVKPVLVIYDALSYAHTGNENSHEDMSPVIDTLASLRAEGCTVAILAHLDKDRGENPRADIDTQIRGSSIIVNAYDCHIALRRYKMTQAHIDCVIRSRDDEERRYSAVWNIDSEALTARLSFLQVIEGEKDTQDLLVKCKAIMEQDPDGVWTSRRLRELWGVSEKTARTIRDALVKSGALEQTGGSFRRPLIAEEA